MENKAWVQGMSGYTFDLQGRAYSPDGSRAESADTGTEARNKQTEQDEIAWLKTGPDKVFLYVKMPDSYEEEPYAKRMAMCAFAMGGIHSPNITTWLGTSVATDVWVGRSQRIGFGGATRRAVTCLIYGIRYNGWYFESSGSYCRLRKAKERK